MVESQPENSPDHAERTTAVDSVVASPAAEEPPKVNGAASRNGQASSTEPQSLLQAMRPVLQTVEAMARVQCEQAGTLGRLETAMLGQEVLPRMVTEIKQALEQKGSLNRAMFEALHAELKSYKEGFLLDSVVRPVIRDLISLFDDITEIHRQLTLALSTHEKRGELTGGELILFENVLSPLGRLEHNRDSILEVLERLGVSTIPSNTGKLDKRSQRAVSVELVEDPEQDQQIAKVVRCGFQWRERMIRPEEVIIKKRQEACLIAEKS